MPLALYTLPVPMQEPGDSLRQDKLAFLPDEEPGSRTPRIPFGLLDPFLPRGLSFVQSRLVCPVRGQAQAGRLPAARLCRRRKVCVAAPWI
jgi:hypothetical protein